MTFSFSFYQSFFIIIKQLGSSFVVEKIAIFGKKKKPNSRWSSCAFTRISENKSDGELSENEEGNEKWIV